MKLLSALTLLFAITVAADESFERGKIIYEQKCQLCHQPTGQGAPPVFPPLAGADWLVKNREATIRALCEGLQGKIHVNGADYDGVMPAQVLDDRGVADVLNFTGQSWGNKLPPFLPAEVAAARAKTRFPSYEKLVRASAFAPLPKPPKPYTVREVARLPEENDFGTRLAGGAGGVFVLANSGRVWRLDEAAGALVDVFRPRDYLDLSQGGVSALGMTVAANGELWICTNQHLAKASPPENEVVIHRAAPGAKPKAWFKHRYPHGGGFNHGASHIAFGADGMLYVSSGSRTDGGEKPKNHPDSPAGEMPTTACLWKLDPKATTPKIEVLAPGIRNAYGFAWDGAGRLFIVSNGPDANSAEEMDFIEPGKHYGFPFQFSDWPVEQRPYAHTPAAPAGLNFSHPVKNQGPAGGTNLATFDAHSSPAGMIWCGKDFPEPLRESFLVTRYGNLLGEDRTGTGDDVGFDVLAVKLEREGGGWIARTETFLAPLGRPIDVLRTGPGRALILEYTRATNFKDGLGWLPGRMIEIRAE